MNDEQVETMEDGVGPVAYEPSQAEVERLRAHVEFAASQAIDRFRKEEWLTDDEIVSTVKQLSSEAGVITGYGDDGPGGAIHFG